MYTRVIPALLLDRGRLVKTRRFTDARYVGDPRNTIRIFNAREVDELFVLDISAGNDGRLIDWELLEELASESFVPMAYGGGVRDADTAMRILDLGYEKVVIGREAMRNPRVLTSISSRAGRQAVVACLDFISDGEGLAHSLHPFADKPGAALPEIARALEAAGAGEILLHDSGRDGMRTGFAVDVIASVADVVGIPVVALGGARNLEDLRVAVVTGHASAVAAGSLFVFYGPHDAVLINFPSATELRTCLPNRP
jgi:cyclase